MNVDLTALIFGGLVIVGVTIVIVVIIQQILATGRTAISAENRDEYKKLVFDSTEALERTAAGLEKTAEELAELRVRVSELERMLKEVA